MTEVGQKRVSTSGSTTRFSGRKIVVTLARLCFAVCMNKTVRE